MQAPAPNLGGPSRVIILNTRRRDIMVPMDRIHYRVWELLVDAEATRRAYAGVSEGGALPIVQLEFDADVPWLLSEPEPE